MLDWIGMGDGAYGKYEAVRPIRYPTSCPSIVRSLSSSFCGPAIVRAGPCAGGSSMAHASGGVFSSFPSCWSFNRARMGALALRVHPR